ncbi:prolipoprotein diacylglyceryl transferase [Siphonobacter sp. SORGH_AS_0500]|uniref:prolipoprotein diacylglyceryl transferase n=1 Tax=Siphonobacter sp. SORGH_AS_0500 TaxID=1864824 RepID=UPI00285AD204|nr:prolipoprotein diacylglyceryl transferase [Siphonobacter sp. SORGH_AS_0500]MDR6194390.1 phosphatidylglycerol:prolipoprotein diacylglycerol transferase [Siphonobacter sp. SORGH_AS_0500]
MLNYIVWDVNPEIFNIGSFSVRWYGLLFALGFLIGQRIILHIFRKEGLPEDWVDSLTLYMVLATVIGARVGHYIFYEYPMFFANPWRWFKDMLLPPYAGLASHGAAIGIFTGLYLFARAKKIHFFWITDRIVITVALAGCFIRLGNLMNSEIVGKATSVPWAFIFVNNTEFSPVPRHPSQLYEAISCFILCIVLYLIWRRYKTNLPQGLTTGIFMVVVFTLRFVYEFYKENQVTFEDQMTYNLGQLLSVPAVLFGLVGIFWAIRRHETSIFLNSAPQSVRQNESK